MRIIHTYRIEAPRILALGVLASSLLASGAGAEPVLDWNNALLSAARATRVSPPVFSRASAVVHLSIYEAVNGIARTHQPYHVGSLAPAGASLDAAVAAAGHTAALAVFAQPEVQQTNFTALYEASLAQIPEGQAKVDGIAWGRSAAEAVVALRGSDGSNASVPYTEAPGPGVWKPTPPANAAALLPGWGRVTGFCMPPGGAFRPHLPPALGSSAYAWEWDLVRQYGSKVSAVRSDDQTQIALFWSDGAGTETPPGHWNHIAQSVSVARSLGTVENARLFALLNLALADAAICSWDAKYAYSLWRPLTAIREADTDGNPLTSPDTAWEPLITTPPFPEYTSGHSTFSRAAAVVLAGYFGRDDIAFQTGSDGLPGVTRSYSGFGAAADESGISRIYGGIHWPSANVAGQTTGHLVGRQVVDLFLVPLTAPTFGRIKVEGTTVDLSLQAESGRSYRIQGSIDMRTWIDVATGTAVDGKLEVRDTTPQAFRFYRAQAL